jgi:hypothetical protein
MSVRLIAADAGTTRKSRRKIMTPLDGALIAVQVTKSLARSILVAGPRLDAVHEDLGAMTGAALARRSIRLPGDQPSWAASQALTSGRRSRRVLASSSTESDAFSTSDIGWSG